MGQTICVFSSFSQINVKYIEKFDYKSIHGVLEIWTGDLSMVGAEESTELWQPPRYKDFSSIRAKNLWNL